MDAWCDSLADGGNELVDYDPRILPSDPAESESLARLLSTFDRYESNPFFHPLHSLESEKYYFGTSNHHERRFFSPILHHLINYYPYKDWCERHHPERDPVKCATSYLFLKGNVDRMDRRGNSLTEYSDSRLGEQIKEWW